LYDEIADSVVKVFDQINTHCKRNDCPGADFAGCIVRLAGHDFMDFRVKSE